MIYAGLLCSSSRSAWSRDIHLSPRAPLKSWADPVLTSLSPPAIPMTCSVPLSILVPFSTLGCYFTGSKWHQRWWTSQRGCGLKHLPITSSWNQLIHSFQLSAVQVTWLEISYIISNVISAPYNYAMNYHQFKYPKPLMNAWFNHPIITFPIMVIAFSDCGSLVGDNCQIVFSARLSSMHYALCPLIESINEDAASAIAAT